MLRIMAAAIGLGLAALGRPGYLNLGHGDDLGDDRSADALEERTHEVLDAAHALGIRYFDAARSYGMAEQFLGSWLTERDVEPGTVAVGSKWGYTYTADWQIDADPPEVKDLSIENFRRQVKQTLDLLGEHLTLYQIHSATIDSGVLDDEELLEELSDLREEGIAVGLTVTGPDQADTIDKAIATRQFDSVQATWNLIERSAGEALQRAADAGMRVIVKEALANGRLAGREPVPVLERAARSLGTTMDAVAIAAVTAQPWADVVLSGVATVDQLKSNLLARGVALGPGLVEELEVLREPPDVYWDRRSGLRWT
jgi:aryl-alcohol dehydrogenase-like predicted oxidoreductase